MEYKSFVLTLLLLLVISSTPTIVASLKIKMHSYGTNIEGKWDEVFLAVKQCHETLHQMGAPRISTNLRLGTRTDRNQTMEDKIQSVEKRLGNTEEEEPES